MNKYKVRIIERDKNGITKDFFDIEVEADTKKQARQIARIIHPLPQFTLGKVWNNE